MGKRNYGNESQLKHLSRLFCLLSLGGACRQPSVLRSSLLNSSSACTSKTKPQKQMSAA